jgi:hypothetical protein
VARPHAGTLVRTPRGVHATGHGWLAARDAAAAGAAIVRRLGAPAALSGGHLEAGHSSAHLPAAQECVRGGVHCCGPAGPVSSRLNAPRHLRAGEGLSSARLTWRP